MADEIIELRSNTEIRLDCFNLALEIITQEESGNVNAVFLLADRIYEWVKQDG